MATTFSGLCISKKNNYASARPVLCSQSQDYRSALLAAALIDLIENENGNRINIEWRTAP